MLLALLLGGDFYTGAVLASALTKLIVRCAEISQDEQQVNSLKAEAMLIMVSVIRVGQSKFVTVPIDEDSNERIMSCIQTLSDLDKQSSIQEVFLKDTKAAYSKMILAQEVRCLSPRSFRPKTYCGLLVMDSL
jgi:coatomer subunit beta